MKAAMKVAAPMPARGAPVMKAAVKVKAKAIAAKSFAAVAAKVKAKGSDTPKGEGTWHFMSDLRFMEKGADLDKAWTKYDPKTNKTLESAYAKGFKQYTSKVGD